MGLPLIHAQQYMSGKVIRPSGEPIPRALVKVGQEGEPVISENDGTFRIRLETDQSFDSLQASKDNYTFQDWEFRETEIYITMKYTPNNRSYPTIYYIRGRLVSSDGEGVAKARVSLLNSTALRPVETDASGYFALQLNRELEVSRDMIFAVNGAELDSRYFTLRPDANSVVIELPEGGLAALEQPEVVKPDEKEAATSAEAELPVRLKITDSTGTVPLTSYIILYADSVFKTDKSGIIEIPKSLLNGQSAPDETGFELNAGDQLIELLPGQEEGTYEWQLRVRHIEADTATSREDTSRVDEYTDQVNQTLDLIENEKRQLALNGARISAKIERLAAKLRNTEDLNPDQTKQLRMEVNRLREALRENEAAFAKAQERTRELLRQVNTMMQETEQELERTAAEQEADRRRLLLVSSLVILLGIIAFAFYRNARRIQKQKNELEQVNRNMDLLGKIGRDLTSKLSLAAISNEVYADVNDLMDANIFALGIHRPSMKQLFFPASIEKGEKLLPYSYDERDEAALLSVRCLQNQEEIIIQNFDKEFHNYLPESSINDTEDLPLSVVYLPLISGDHAIGVLTVQSYKREAYTDYHLSILRNLAIYISIAVENAKVYEEIANQNRKITDSINYAQRIQASIFPAAQDIAQFFADHLIFYRPRDIVSGDFYYFHRLDNGKAVMAGVDCTGHGVPGGFMSLIGHELLNDLIVRQQLDNPAEIMDQMHKGVIQMLHQDQGEAAQDGMEVTMCVFEPDQRQVHIASSHMPVMIFNEKRPDGLLEIKGDRLSVGGMYHKEKRGSFQLHTIDLQEGDHIYFFSDGFQDQFGGPSNRKFLKKRLRALLREAQKETDMKAQHALITRRFEEWKGEYAQIDDVLLIGLQASPQKG
mgnify:FL=1